MRNLKNIRWSTVSFDQGLALSATAWDAVSDDLICAFGPTQGKASITLARVDPSSAWRHHPQTPRNGLNGEQVGVIAAWDAPCPLPDLVCDRVLSLHYSSEDAQACLVLAGGDIIVVREQPASHQEKVEVMGTVDVGITAARWSPDGELLAITTRADTLLYMSRDIENVAEVPMTAEDLKASNHVSVGWGKSETQFKGKRAKALRDPTMPETVDHGRPSPCDQGRAIISWRGDGAYLAISTLQPESRRIIRVYSRDGQLDSVSEPVDGLEGALSWRPAGNLMAAVQRKTDRLEVVFFERNGLRHGEFALRLGVEEMSSWASDVLLDWNIDSTVLAIYFKDRVQLWTMGNYHYYLKQDIPFPTFSLAVTASSNPWHPEASLRLALPLSCSMTVLEYALITARGSTMLPSDYGVQAVIDGAVLKVTPLRTANMPPPMALLEISTSSNVIDAAVSRSGTHIAALCGPTVDVYVWQPSNPSDTEHQRTHRINLSKKMTPMPRQICFLEDSHIFILGSDHIRSVIYQYSVLDQQSPETCYEMPTHISRMFASLDYERICVQTEANVVAESALEHGKLGLQDVTKLPTSTPWIESIHHAEQSIVFGLSANGSLYANERLLVRNCTSFLATSAHLILTTTQHLIKFVHMATVEFLQVPPDNPESDERCRSIERGAKLITVMPTTFSVVLQMPRGNLETIYPRALVLAGIRRSIANKDYKTAFFACRNHRVDMNILHDHAPEQFMAQVGLFVDQVKKIEHIDLFLSQLREEDVSRTMYQETSPSEGMHEDDSKKDISEIGQPSQSKVNRICDALLAALNQRGATNLQNIITAHVCKVPPDLDAGLLVVGRLRRENSNLLERAVEHICFLADINRLYDNALGLYDLDLTLLVAQQSQKDPREYLPFLQKLQEMTQLRRQYTIDDGLKRHGKALKHLHDMEAVQEVNLYVVKHELFEEGLKLCRYQAPRLNEILKLYAEHLDQASQFDEAAPIYDYLSEHTKAMEAYRAAGRWREALFSASRIPLEPGRLRDLATTLADGLYEAKDYFNAATLYLDYKDDVELAARSWCKGYFFAEAARILGLKRRLDLLEPVIDQGLIDGLVTTSELLAECRGQINAQVPRIRELRTKKEEDPRARSPPVAATIARLTFRAVGFYDGPTTEGDIPDNVSLANTTMSTSASLFTRYTGQTGSLNSHTTRRSSKNRRREERKRARGKKGSVYEEEYLVNSLRRLMERVDSVRDDVDRLLRACATRHMRERGLALERAMSDVLALCQRCVVEVFEPAARANVRVSQDADAGGKEEEQEGGRTEVSLDVPIVQDMKRLAILG
ncbi:MAG: hypothetical protein M1838_000111 [Thelocarpon superellum]|nr:MAG: hypothetical protein M1838_000111 [Thelocarpon superellum]